MRKDASGTTLLYFTTEARRSFSKSLRPSAIRFSKAGRTRGASFEAGESFDYFIGRAHTLVRRV
jgi:hypothetical protein